MHKTALAAAMLMVAASPAGAQAADPAAPAAAPTERGDWVVDTRLHAGCDRHRWCRARRWDPARADYEYLDCYWGGCAVPNGGYGGYGGRGY